MRCFHCSEQVPECGSWSVEFLGIDRPVCCPGCEAVMQAIVDAGLGDYYQFRTEPAPFGLIPEDLSEQLDKLTVYDSPEISERYLSKATPADPASSQTCLDVNLSVSGMHCGACVWVLERSLAALPGVSSASVNFSSSRALVRYDPEQLRLSDILRATIRVGYQTMPFDARERETSMKQESRVFLQRLFVAGVASMQVMMYALPAYLSGEQEMEVEYAQLLRWASLVVTTPVLLFSAQPFLKGAWLDLKRRRPGMDVPVSIGLLAAFFASVWATWSGTGHIYFDSVAMFVFLLLAARYMEWSARRRAMRSIDDICSAAPETAQRRVEDGAWETVPAARLQVGDRILINAGDRVPVDAIVQIGSSAIDNSLVTGESVPVLVGVGDTLPGGSLLSGSPVQCLVARTRNTSTLSVIDGLVQRGASEKPQSVKVADRVASVFVTLLLVFAVAVFALWWMIDPSRAATIAIAVLVVSCPCALSLATPSALAASTGVLLKHHLLVTRGHALETLAKVTDIVFDKTGTLTVGMPVLTQTRLGPGQQQHDILQLAAALESGSSHPYAAALRRAAEQESAEAFGQSTQQAHDDVHSNSVLPREDGFSELASLGHEVAEIEHCAGHGVSAALADGTMLRLGSASWCQLGENEQRLWQATDTAELGSASEVYLSRNTPLVSADANLPAVAVQVLARFLIRDVIRPEVPSLIRSLQKTGLRVHLLSGDREGAVSYVATQLGVADYAASMSPEQKQAYVLSMQSSGAVVLMVGDGINDAPVLANADVSLAVGNASSLTRNAADVISLLPGLEGLEWLLRKSVQTMKVVRQNLLWAALYNASAIPLAAMGIVPPWAAAIGMALSSLLVVGNAQRLWSTSDLALARKDSRDQMRPYRWNRSTY